MSVAHAPIPATTETPRLSLSRFAVRRFRTVEDCELHPSGGFNVVLGRNAAGKTTLLELLARSVAGDFAGLEAEPFEVDVTLTRGEFTVEFEYRNDPKPLRGLQSVVAGRFREAAWAWSGRVSGPALTEPIEFRHGPEKAQGVVGGETFTLPVASLFEGGALAVASVAERAPNLPESLSLELIEFAWDMLFSGMSGGRMDEGLGLFHGITGRFSPDMGPTVTMPVLGVRHLPDDSVQVVPLGPVPAEFVHEAQRQLSSGSPTTLRFGSEHSPILGLLARTFGAKAIEASMHLDEGKEGNLRFNRTTLLIEYPDGTRLSEQHLSYGQKRLVALLWMVASSQSVVVVDELVNGLHYDWIEALVQGFIGAGIGHKQFFLSSQNPLLLDMLEFESAESIQRAFIRCDLADDRAMTWRHLSTEESERIFRAYEAGVQHVSEILRAEGLW